MDTRYEITFIRFTLGRDGRVDWVSPQPHYETVERFDADEYLMLIADPARPRLYKLVLSAKMTVTSSRWWGWSNETLTVVDVWKHPLFVALDKLMTNVEMTGMISVLFNHHPNDELLGLTASVRAEVHTLVAAQAARELALRERIRTLPGLQGTGHLREYIEAALRLLQGLT